MQTLPHELYDVPRGAGQADGLVGHPLKAFHPSAVLRKKFYVQQSFTISIAGENECPAVAETKPLPHTQASKFAPVQDVAQATFTWPPIPYCNSKPCDPSRFDPDFELIGAGAHAPLQVYVVSSSQGRRTPQANTKRAAKRFSKKADTDE